MLSLGGSIPDCSLNIVGEVRVHDNVQVEIVFQVLGTFTSSMAVKNSENLDLGPQLIIYLRLLKFRLNHIENDCDTIFVCFPDQARVCVS